MKENIEFTEKELILVRSRLKAMPEDLSIITLGKSYSKKELIEQLENKTDFATRIAIRELNYVKRLWENSNDASAD